MLSEGLLSLIIVAAIIWFWLDSARAREIATAIGIELCRRQGLQFLEGTATLDRLGLNRTPGGIQLCRRFNFEYSEEGTERHTGSITMIGKEMHHFELKGHTWLEGAIKDQDGYESETEKD